MMILDSGLLF